MMAFFEGTAYILRRDRGLRVAIRSPTVIHNAGAARDTWYGIAMGPTWDR